MAVIPHRVGPFSGCPEPPLRHVLTDWLGDVLVPCRHGRGRPGHEPHHGSLREARAVARCHRSTQVAYVDAVPDDAASSGKQSCGLLVRVDPARVDGVLATTNARRVEMKRRRR